MNQVATAAGQSAQQRTPRVSVVMTVYNGAPFLRAAIDSVLAQTFPDWELVIFEDGSSDDSRAILASYTDPRIRVHVNPRNLGRLVSVRAAVDASRGEYVAVLDADDVAAPTRLEQQVAVLDADPGVILVGSWARLIDERSERIGAFHPPTTAQELHDYFAWANPITHSSAMFRAAAYREVGGYPTTMQHSHDCALWTRLAARGKVAMVAEELCDQRVVSTSMTRGPRFRADVVRDQLLLAKEAGSILQLPARAAALNRHARLIAEVKWGIYQFRTGARMAGLWTLLQGVARHPLGLLRSHRYRREHLL